MLCENWDPARAVLAQSFGTDKRDIAGNVAEVRSIPGNTDIVTAGFPCTDLSQAGRMAGIDGEASGSSHTSSDSCAMRNGAGSCPPGSLSRTWPTCFNSTKAARCGTSSATRVARTPLGVQDRRLPVHGSAATAQTCHTRRLRCRRSAARSCSPTKPDHVLSTTIATMPSGSTGPRDAVVSAGHRTPCQPSRVAPQWASRRCPLCGSQASSSAAVWRGRR